MAKQKKWRGIPTYLQTQVPMVKTPGVPVVTPEVKVENMAQKPVEDKTVVTAWTGFAVPVKCPLCSATVLGDRLTKACIVTTTRKERVLNGFVVVDRDMVCRWCSGQFMTRERVREL